ncbi:centrosomal protein of 19 kDa-like isoform X2 [Clavelina lepadiformis]
MATKKLRCRQMPLRNFKETSNISQYAEELKKNQRHRTLLSDISQLQLEKMLLVVQGHMKGLSLEESVEQAESDLTIDPDKDLNKLETEQVDKAKRIMDETFNQHRIKADDPEFEYNVEVEFQQPIESSGWDSDDEF